MGMGKEYRTYWKEEIETAPRETIEALQLRELKEEVAFAYEHSPYYRRSFDAAGVKLIWVQEPPEGSAWDAVRDRLHRAAAAQ